MPGTWAIIVAAGRGSRLGGETPKQYLHLGKHSILTHTLRKFATHSKVDGIMVVIHPDDSPLFQDNCAAFTDRVLIQHGGDTRQESVRNGLLALQDQSPDCVLIHDAARPFVSDEVISNLVNVANEGTAAIAASPVVDSLKYAPDTTIEKNIERAGLWHAQTPQAFPYSMIVEAHLSVTDQENHTDDAAVAEACGNSITLIHSDRSNFKITTNEDLELAKNMILNPQNNRIIMESRTGLGYDVHCFEDGDHVTLCGVNIPHTRKLKGHSDADVGLHALTDAILGALCEGDIGTHFPPSDPQWKGAKSDQFLEFARDLVIKRGGKIIHVDVTLVCERPKIGPHRDSMVTRMSEILDISSSRVSIKATTSERLGFTGREEGIAAQAVATIQIPAEN
ncbi:bifunctional 2-C-methyl-D-erythritol 4-phosphate cytidylyltransferase/2-C-methyl-D-erythritol 2,4-cyclodiphosphate synthase [Rhodospirillales bacterium 47_12_T64]|nr:bifunctional 2-C-methyl-D-erythritol 4-phosphate cytidylyltransferase/2-C-methyl-D-erythritol 2,4-cyclodiphosphate synthase [Rhodospirillales bacterium 47_12_T64]